MSSSPVMIDPTTPEHGGSASPAGTLLVCLPSSSSESLQQARIRLSHGLPGVKLLFAAPGADEIPYEGQHAADGALLSLPVPSRTYPAWVLVASDYAAAAALAQQHGATATLILGSEMDTLSDIALEALSTTALSGTADVIFPRYVVKPHEALVSAALLHPLTRTLFGAVVHGPLPLDIAFSARATEKLGSAARRLGVTGGNEPLLWPAAEASIANLRITEVPAGPHALPPPADIDLNSLLAEVLGSAFTDIESKAVVFGSAHAFSVLRPRSQVHKPPPPLRATSLLTRSPPWWTRSVMPSPTSSRSGLWCCRRTRFLRSKNSR